MKEFQKFEDKNYSQSISNTYSDHNDSFYDSFLSHSFCDNALVYSDYKKSYIQAKDNVKKYLKKKKKKINEKNSI